MNKKKISISILIFIALYCCPLQCKPLDITNEKEDFYNHDEYNGNLDRKTIQQIRKCEMDLETMELCMRCAKITKSIVVYPPCCDNEDKIKDWCHNYVFFGTS